jgi:CHAT domain-containing protein/tetratricopeptide (TPR) repeat protein
MVHDRWVVLVFLLLAAAACHDRPPSAPSLHSLMMHDPHDRDLKTAELDRNRGDYLNAIQRFDSLITMNRLSGASLRYARGNLQLCQLLVNDTIRHLSNDSAYVRTTEMCAQDLAAGIVAMRNGKTGSSYFRHVRQLLVKQDSATFEYFLVLELLGQSYRLIDGKMDSALYYFKKAAGLTRTYPVLTAHRPRLLLEAAQGFLIGRDEVTGLVYVNEALEGTMEGVILARGLMLKGTLFRKLGYYDSAETTYGRAEKEIINHNLPDLAPELLRERILMSILQKNDSAFRRHMHRLLACRPESLRNSRVNIDRLYGFFYYKRGEAEKSVLYYERALAQLTRQRVPDLVLVMESFYALTEQYRALKRFDDAERCAFRCLVFNTPLRDAEYTWNKLMDPAVIGVTFNFVNYDLLANVFLMRAREHPADVRSLKKALTLYSFIDSIMLRQVRVVQEDAVINFLNVGHRVYSGGIEASYLAYGHTRDTAYLELAHQFMERSKALIIYRDILVRSTEYFPDVPATFRQRELALKARLSELRRNAAFNSTDMMNALNSLEAYFGEMERKYPQYFAAKYKLNIPSFHHFQQLSLAQRTTVVQYHTTIEYIYYLTYSGKPQFGRIANDERFAEALSGLYQQLDHAHVLQGAAGCEAFMRHSNFLYRQLITPLQRPDTAVLVIPDGSLQYLPFELLVSNIARDYAQADFLVKTHNLNYSQSLKTYELTLQARNRPIQKVLTYTQGEGRDGLVGLPGTKKELTTIRQVFGQARVTSRQNAEVTRSQLLLDLQKPYDLVHIGLHASSSATDRLDNKIFCAGHGHANADVYGYDIVPLKIQAQTVVLTSCQSAFGPSITGEGTFSLARAFKQAGVSNVISSLWNLTDQSTADVSDSFYTYLHQGYSASESLTLAKRTYLSNADEITAHPYFWAAMICQGR